MTTPGTAGEMLPFVSDENPWLRVPLADYEGHMRAPGVEQLDALAELFAQALRTCGPRSVAVLGVAGGNGLDAIDRSVVGRIVGIDINPAYLAEAALRYAHLPLELHRADVAADDLSGIEPVDLVHAALIFEHSGTGHCLDNAMRLLRPEGHLCVVLQLPSVSTADVSPSPFETIQQLADDFSLVDRIALIETLSARGLRLVAESRWPTEGGKTLWLGIFHGQHPRPVV